MDMSSPNPAVRDNLMIFKISPRTVSSVEAAGGESCTLLWANLPYLCWNHSLFTAKEKLPISCALPPFDVLLIDILLYSFYHLYKKCFTVSQFICMSYTHITLKRKEGEGIGSVFVTLIHFSFGKILWITHFKISLSNLL